MDKSEQYADEAQGRFNGEHRALCGKHVTHEEGMLHLSEFVWAEAKRAYQAGQADRDRKESKDESGGIS